MANVLALPLCAAPRDSYASAINRFFIHIDRGITHGATLSRRDAAGAQASRTVFIIVPPQRSRSVNSFRRLRGRVGAIGGVLCAGTIVWCSAAARLDVVIIRHEHVCNSK